MSSMFRWGLHLAGEEVTTMVSRLDRSGWAVVVSVVSVVVVVVVVSVVFDLGDKVQCHFEWKKKILQYNIYQEQELTPKLKMS